MLSLLIGSPATAAQKLPANARQIICAARPATLRLTGNELFELADPDLRPARSVDVRFRNEEIRGASLWIGGKCMILVTWKKTKPGFSAKDAPGGLK